MRCCGDTIFYPSFPAPNFLRLGIVPSIVHFGGQGTFPQIVLLYKTWRPAQEVSLLEYQNKQKPTKLETEWYSLVDIFMLFKCKKWIYSIIEEEWIIQIAGFVVCIWMPVWWYKGNWRFTKTDSIPPQFCFKMYCNIKHLPKCSFYNQEKMNNTIVGFVFCTLNDWLVIQEKRRHNFSQKSDKKNLISPNQIAPSIL